MAWARVRVRVRVRVRAKVKEVAYSSATRAGSPTWLGVGLRLGLELGVG